tara:strand:- start:431 stop:613 length:183 start_codon:yes stop_codon:yes gene_type:complete
MNTMETTMENTQTLTTEEWMEMDSLRKAITENPAAVHPEKMEKFAELLIRSWKENECSIC